MSSTVSRQEADLRQVLVASRNPLVRRGIRDLIEGAFDAVEVTESSGGCQLEQELADSRTELAVVDVDSEVHRTSDILRMVRPAALVLLVADSEHEHADVPSPGQPAADHSVWVLRHGCFGDGDFVRTLNTIGVRLRRTSTPHIDSNALANNDETTARPGGASDRDGGMLQERLSAREREVMAYISQGYRNAEIAHMMWLSEKTVKNHINRIFTKLGVDTRAQAIVLWFSEAGGQSN